jgi:hypothetical protein
MNAKNDTICDKQPSWHQRLVRQFRLWRAQQKRTIPDSYFDGYRRLAETPDQVVGQHCHNCRHAVAYVSWWCDRKDLGRKWSRCHAATEITKADRRAGGDRWIGLPDT